MRTRTRDELAAESGADVSRVEAVRTFLDAGVTLGHIQAALRRAAARAGVLTSLPDPVELDPLEPAPTAPAPRPR